MGFAAGFKAGMDIGGSLIDTYNTAKRQREFSDTGTYVSSLAAIVANQGTATPDAAPVSQVPELAQRPAFNAKTTTSFLGKNYDQAPDESTMSSARIQAMAGVMEQHGDPEAAMRYRQQAKQGDLADLQLAQAKRAGLASDQATTDNQALRKAMLSGIPTVSATDNQASGQPVPTGQPLTPKNLQSQHNDLQTYLRNAAPQVVKTLVSQGKLEEAQRYMAFMDSANGKAYATAWTTGLRKHAFGHHAGAIKAFEALYNGQLFDDGHTVKMDPVDGGQQYQVQMFDPQGKNVGTQTLDPKTLASQAALMLDPLRAVEFHAQQQGKRDAEAATLDRQIQFEGVRQAGSDTHLPPSRRRAQVGIHQRHCNRSALKPRESAERKMSER